MPRSYSIFVFLGSLTLVIGGSVFLSRALGRLGPRLNIPEQLLGFITALGADSPEISAAVVSMISGQQDVAVGVVFGSNLFNLASLLGVTAVIAGQISLPRAAVLLKDGKNRCLRRPVRPNYVGAKNNGNTTPAQRKGS